MSLKTAVLVAAALLMAAAVAPPAVSQLIKVNVVVSGTVPCTTAAVNITLTTPVFANATVVLRCGEDIVGATVTNINGAFSLMIGGNLSPALSGRCRLVVPTPLSVCNSSLPSNGTLQAPLQLISSNLNLGGILGVITNFGSLIFQLLP